MKIISILFLLLFTSTLLAYTPTQDALVGNWISEQNDLIVYCYKTKSGNYEAKVIWFKKYPIAKPDPNLHKIENAWLQKIVVKNMKYNNTSWTGGTVLDIKKNNTYSATIKLTDPNTLELRGYILIPALGKTAIFKRYQSSVLPPFNWG
jgi:uncharacterized protein (DUF2147 family)